VDLVFREALPDNDPLIEVHHLIIALHLDDLAAAALDADVGDRFTLSFQGDLRFAMRHVRRGGSNWFRL
jgi:hypothetical protein